MLQKIRKMSRSANIVIGGGIVFFLFTMLLISFFYTPYDPMEMQTKHRFQAPDSHFLFGTDNFGRDLLSRIMEASQTAFLVGIIAVGIGLIFGILFGAIAGYFGGWVDEVIMRIMDAMMALPGILFALMFVSVFGVGIVNTMIAIGIMSIPGFARITRGGVLQAKEFDYVTWAKAIGTSRIRIVFVHILPNVFSPLIVASSLAFAGAVLTEAALSYLGLGIQPPDPSWGRMLNEAQTYIFKAPWMTFAPGIMITLMVLGFNLLGDGIRDLRDVRKKH